jgi:hypothetical protein
VNGDVVGAQSLQDGFFDTVAGSLVSAARTIEDDLYRVLASEFGVLNQLWQQLLGENLLNGLLGLMVGIDTLCLYALDCGALVA